MKRCVILGAAPFGDATPLCAYLQADDTYFVADGGNRLAEALGVQPALIVADYDSSARADGCCEQIVLPQEKDVTDTRAAMDIAYARGFRELLLLGCLGGRMDHTVANLLAARQLTEMGAHVVLADANNEITVLLPGEYCLEADGFSVFAMTDIVEGLTITGAKYPLADFTLASDNALCVSNEAVDKEVVIAFQKGVLLLVCAKD